MFLCINTSLNGFLRYTFLCEIVLHQCCRNGQNGKNANLYKFAYFAGGTDLVSPANACWGRFPKPLRSPPAVTAARSANAGFYIGTKRKSCANGFPIHTAFLLPVYLAERSIFRMFPYHPLPKGRCCLLFSLFYRAARYTASAACNRNITGRPMRKYQCLVLW